MTRLTVSSLKEEVDSIREKANALSINFDFIKNEVDQIKLSLKKEFEYQNRRHSELTRTLFNLENRLSKLLSHEEKESLNEMLGDGKKKIFSTVIFGFKVTVTKEKI